MAAPSTSILDTFNRANGALGANWSSPTYAGDDSPTVISNACGQSGSDYADANWNGATYTESEVYATLTVVPATGNQVYLMARIQSPNTSGMDAYTLLLTKASGTDTLDVMRTINGADTSIATRSQEVSAGDALGLVVLGTGATVTIQVWYRASGGSWTQLGADISDTNANRITAAGRIGLGLQNSTARWDDFGGGEQSGTIVGLPLLGFRPRGYVLY